MRVDLLTPFAEKDQAKGLGARWDATRKVWYVQDVDDLTPFLRWIPDLSAATRSGEGVPGSDVRASDKRASTTRAPTAITKPPEPIASCGCSALPWEDCMHLKIQT